MSALSWRRLLLSLCACSLLSVLAHVWSDSEVVGDAGFDWLPSGKPFVDRIGNVDPHGPAAIAGIRNGDLVDMHALSPPLRMRWYTGIRYGIPAERALALPVLRNGAQHIVSFTPPRRRVPWDSWLEKAGLFWMLGFAALLAWRRPGNAEGRVLCLFLILVPAAISLTYLSLPNVTAQIALNLLGFLCYLPSIPLLAVYAMLLARPPDTARRVLASLSYLFELAATGTMPLLFWVYWTDLFDPTGFVVVQKVLALLTLLLPLLCVFGAIMATRGAERERAVWTTSTLGFFYVAFFLFNALPLLPQFASGAGLNLVFTLTRVALLVAPLGMTYALLNRRLLDVGFVLNRAVVFTGVSVVVVGIFVLVEWALSAWFSSASHTTNLAISAALALALGLSVRAIHARVDRVLDAVFFRKRHEDEQAIRTLAREAAYITDPGVLLSRIVAVLEEHADASSARVLLDSGDRYDLVIPSPSTPPPTEATLRTGSAPEARSRGTDFSQSVSENDPAIVRLRATQKVLDLHDVQSVIVGEFAYPMLARGRLVGVLVLGPKRSGESYAPDESEAIAQLAHDAGAALDVLAMKDGKPAEGLHDELRAIRESIKHLQHCVDSALSVRTTS